MSPTPTARHPRTDVQVEGKMWGEKICKTFHLSKVCMIRATCSVVKTNRPHTNSFAIPVVGSYISSVVPEKTMRGSHRNLRGVNRWNCDTSHHFSSVRASARYSVQSSVSCFDEADPIDHATSTHQLSRAGRVTEYRMGRDDGGTWPHMAIMMTRSHMPIATLISH